MIRSETQARAPKVALATRSKAKRTMRTGSTEGVKYVGLILLAILLLILSAITGYQIRRVSYDISACRAELSALGMKELNLKRELDSLKSKEHLEKIGKTLGLHPPKKHQIVFLKGD